MLAAQAGAIHSTLALGNQVGDGVAREILRDVLDVNKAQLQGRCDLKHIEMGVDNLPESLKAELCLVRLLEVLL